VVVHTVVVVTGTVVGTVVGVVVVTGFVVGVEVLPDVVVVGDGTVVVALSSDDDEPSPESVEVLVVVEGTVTGVVVAGFAAPAKYITATPEMTPEPTRSAWVSRRTRAKRRSRCWGVRGVGVIRFPYVPVLRVILKS
jgi:hypothetical protein